MIGDSPEIREVLRQIEKIGPSTACVLIQGETGSGKELAARAIHWFSERRHEPFVAVNCGAVPDTLIETELFGHGKGAFTDAKEARPGVIAQAERGTLFLDEIDTLSPKAQVALLRFLQDLRYRPVGTTTELVSNVRIIAAANQELESLVDAGHFRRDLLYRMNIFVLWIPPLRSRPADIESSPTTSSASSATNTASPQSGSTPTRWSGFVVTTGRATSGELENWIHRELLLAEGEEIRNGPPEAVAAHAAASGDARPANREGAGTRGVRKRLPRARPRRRARERDRRGARRRQRAASLRQADEEVRHRQSPLPKLTAPARRRRACRSEPPSLWKATHAEPCEPRRSGSKATHPGAQFSIARAVLWLERAVAESAGSPRRTRSAAFCFRAHSSTRTTVRLLPSVGRAHTDIDRIRALASRAYLAPFGA